MSDLKDSLHVLSPGDKSLPHVHSIITGRKSWKTLKGKTEAVWPPYLETALFEGLAKYQPANPRAKSLGRFPNRNRFISEYIQKSTGKYRTPKQVGSRLQQLRDTCQGKQLLHSLSSGRRPSSERSDDDSSAPSSPIETSSLSGSQGTQPRTVVSIDILPDNNRRLSFSDDNVYNTRSPYNSPPTSPASSPTSATFPSSVSHSEPRSIRVIDPTVTFTSRSSMMAYSSFSVLLDGVCVHSEVVDLKLSTTSCPLDNISADTECIFFYSTTLVPQYWKQLCGCLDPTRYTILHDIIQHSDPSTAESSSGASQDVVLSVEYRFNYPDTPYPSPQLSPTNTLSSAGSNSTLPSPTAYRFDFLTGYPSVDRSEQTYPDMETDFIASGPTICFPGYSPADHASAMPSSNLHLNQQDLIHSYGHFDSGIPTEEAQLALGSFLPLHAYAS